MEELIAKRYVKALASVSKDISGASQVLNALSEAVVDKKIKDVLLSPNVTKEKKSEMILSALGKDADGALVNFIKILGEHKRLQLIPVISRVLNADLQKESNSYEGLLKSKETLGKDELGKLEKTLEKYTGSKIKLSQEKTDLDGLRVLVDDLGIEVNFSKKRVKEQLIDFITKSL